MRIPRYIEGVVSQDLKSKVPSTLSSDSGRELVERHAQCSCEARGN
jgi:hypothetical protein